MSRDFYFYGKLFLGLAIVAGLLQSLIHFLVGYKMFFLGSSPGWFVVAEIITLTASLLVLRYYHFRKYWFAFSSGITVVLAHLLLTAILIRAVASFEYQEYHVFAMIVGLTAGLLYGGSLVLSDTRKSLWLRTVGILTIITTVIFGLGLAQGQITPDAWSAGRLDAINQSTLLVTRLIPVLFIMQFNSELKLLRPESKEKPQPSSSGNALGMLGIVSCVAVLFFGMFILRQAFQSRLWDKRHERDAQKLVEKSDVRTFVNSEGDTLRYLLRKPLDYDPKKKYPLVVCLPYGGYIAPPAQLLSTNVNRMKYPSFIFVPHCDPQVSWGGVPDRFKMIAQDSLVIEAILALTDSAIDERRRYVSGVSKGGYGSWHFIATHPEMFAAAIPVCGAGDPRLAKRVVDVPIWAFHGEDDRNVPVSGSRDMIEAIKSAGGDPRYTEFPDEGHHIWNSVIKTPGVLEWLFAQEKK